MVSLTVCRASTPLLPHSWSHQTRPASNLPTHATNHATNHAPTLNSLHLTYSPTHPSTYITPTPRPKPADPPSHPPSQIAASEPANVLMQSPTHPYMHPRTHPPTPTHTYTLTDPTIPHMAHLSPHTYPSRPLVSLIACTASTPLLPRWWSHQTGTCWHIW